jgi:hypothetical protein
MLLLWLALHNKNLAFGIGTPYVCEVPRAARNELMAIKKPVASQRLELLRSAPMNSWIALSADESRIVAIGSTFMEADEAAKRTGEQGYFLTKTPDSWLPRAMPKI